MPAGRRLLARLGVHSLQTTAGAAAGAMGASAPGTRRFLEALGKAIGVIGASEIGDKTFFIAAVMAMRSSRVTVRTLLCALSGSVHAGAGVAVWLVAPSTKQ